MQEHAMKNGSKEPITQTPEDASTEQETSPPSSEINRTPQQQLSDITDLLSGVNSDNDDDGGDSNDDGTSGAGDVGHGGDSSNVASGQLKLAELAETLDIEPDKLYQMDIPLRDGSTATIGQLKDAYHDQATANAEMQEKADALSSREAGLVADTLALGVLEAMEVLPPSALHKATGHLQEIAEREFGRFTKLYPEYSDRKQIEAFDTGMTEMLGAYGLTSAHFPVKSLGMYQLIKDVLRDRAELKKLKSTPKTPPKSVKSKRGGKPPASKPKAVGRGQGAQVKAIASILGAK